MPHYCVICGEGNAFDRLLPTVESRLEYEYVHSKCLLFYKFNWNKKYYVNYDLYHWKLNRTCSVCNKKHRYKQVIFCAIMNCENRYHIDCAKQHLPIYLNPQHDNTDPRLLLFCEKHNNHHLTPIQFFDDLVRSLLQEQLEYKNSIEPGQIKEKKRKHKHKRKRSRSKSKNHHIVGKFSSSSNSSKRKSSQPYQLGTMTSPKDQHILIIQQPMITIAQVQHVLPPKSSPKKEIVKRESPPKNTVIQIPYPQCYQHEQIKYQEDPEFPGEREFKRDQQIEEWWKKISQIYFCMTNLLPETELEEPQENLNWWSDANEALFEQAQQQQQQQQVYGNNLSINIIYRANSLNKIFKQIQEYFKSISQSQLNVIYIIDCYFYSCQLIRYQFTEQVNQSVKPLKKIKSNIKLYHQDEKIELFEFDGSIGKDLLYMEATELTQDEYLQCLNIDKLETKYRDQLENELDMVQFLKVEQLDIVYHILKDELNQVAQFNNSMKKSINSQLKPYDQIAVHKEQQLLIDLLLWNQIITAIMNGFKDKQSDVLETFYPTPSNTNSQKASINKKKLLSKENTKPLDTDCKICFDYHFSDINPVVYCGTCYTSFHKNCYGLAGPLDDQDILCDSCKYIKSSLKYTKPSSVNKKTIKCRICKKLGFPLKCLKGKFFHVSCLILTNSVIINQGEYQFRQKDQTLSEFKNILSENQESTPQCSICGDSKGYRFRCCVQEIIPCRHAFHPLCAYLHGLSMNISSDNLEQMCAKMEFALLHVQITCALHSDKSLEQLIEQTYYRRFALNFEQTAKLEGYQEFIEEFKHTKGYRYNKQKKAYRYLSTKSPITKNDSLQTLQYNQHNGTTTTTKN